MIQGKHFYTFRKEFKEKELVQTQNKADEIASEIFRLTDEIKKPENSFTEIAFLRGRILAFSTELQHTNRQVSKIEDAILLCKKKLESLGNHKDYGQF